MKTNDTFVIGFNKEKEIIFFKSYDYILEENIVQLDLKWVIDNCDHWELGAANQWKLIHEEKEYNINILNP